MSSQHLKPFHYWRSKEDHENKYVKKIKSKIWKKHTSFICACAENFHLAGKSFAYYPSCGEILISSLLVPGKFSLFILNSTRYIFINHGLFILNSVSYIFTNHD